MNQGEIVTRLLNPKVSQEVTVFSIMRLDIPRQYIREYFRNTEGFMEIIFAQSFGKFSNPPRLEDIQTLILIPEDLKAIKDCKVGDCDIKMPLQAMQRFQKEIDWSASGHEKHVNQLYKEMLVKYVQSYLTKGDAVLMEYRDQKYPLRLFDEFQDILNKSPYLFAYLPKLYRYLENYPKVELPNGESRIYWAKDDLGAKRPVISVNHIIAYEPGTPGIEIVIASKQLYASHYYEASLGLTLLMDIPSETTEQEFDKPNLYLMYFNRSHLDVLRRTQLKFLRSGIKNGILELAEQRLKSLKVKIESLYEAL